MSLIDLDPLIQAVERLICDIGTLASHDGGEAEVKDGVSAPPASPERLDKMARAISAQIKAMADIQEHNMRAAKHDEEKHYLRYEDLPPPSPDERARFTERFIALVGQIEADDLADANSGQRSSQ